jgi:beta-galactosidase
VRGKNSIPPASQPDLERRPTLSPLNRREFLSGAAAVVGAAGIRYPIWALAGPSSAGNLLLGVDYYPDQTPESLWDEDSRMMADFGFTNVRIAEFAWGLMEPAEGKFDFAWLHRAVETLYKYNVAIILGTP